MNKVLVGIPTAPVLDYGEYECDWDAKYGRNEWDRNNRRWERVYGRFNGVGSARQQAVRETWAPEVVKQGASFKFFMGNTATEEHKADDVVILPDVSDKYLFGLQEKIQGMCKWALEHNFDVMIKVDDDSFIYPSLVPYLQQIDGVDYGGLIYGGYCVSGGCGEVYSRRAMEAVANSPLEVHPEQRHWEDWWIASVVRDAGITAVNLPGFFDEANLTSILQVKHVFHPVSPKGMRQAYKEVWCS